MPTEPELGLLHREQAIHAAKDIISVASPLLRELVNYGTHVLVRCQDVATGGLDEHTAQIGLYYHILQMTDGIEVQVSNACAVAAKPDLRSSFEATLSLEFILQPGKDNKNRALAWMYYYIDRRRKNHQVRDPNTQQGKETQAALMREFNFGLTPEVVTEAQRLVKNTENWRIKPHFAPITAELKRRKEYDSNGNLRQELDKNKVLVPKPVKKLDWYNLFSETDDTDGVRSLAKYLNKESLYIFLYKNWSDIIHAGDIGRVIKRNSSGELEYTHIRNPENLDELAGVALYAADFILDAIRFMIHHYLPSEKQDLANWYKNEIQPYHHKLRTMTSVP